MLVELTVVVVVEGHDASHKWVLRVLGLSGNIFIELVYRHQNSFLNEMCCADCCICMHAFVLLNLFNALEILFNIRDKCVEVWIFCAHVKRVA